MNLDFSASCNGGVGLGLKIEQPRLCVPSGDGMNGDGMDPGYTLMDTLQE